MKDNLQLDCSRLLGFKLATEAEGQFEGQQCDPRIGAKIGPKIDPRIGAKIGPKVI